jgi:excisionase family DNA binding protein
MRNTRKNTGKNSTKPALARQVTKQARQTGPPPSLPEQVLTLRETAAYLKISRTKLYHLIKKGLPTFRLDGSVRIDPGELAGWLAQQKE